MRRLLALAALVLLTGAWSCAPRGGISPGPDGGDHETPPCEVSCGHSGHDPDPYCLRDVHPRLCPIGENPS